jgi:dolichol kinase
MENNLTTNNFDEIEQNDIANVNINDKRKKISSNISYQQEVLRKSIHLVSLSIPTLYIFVTRNFALSILIPMAIITIVIDVFSKFENPVQKTILYLFGGMLRDHEKDTRKFALTGASWVLISAVITVFFFPKVIAVVAFMILIVSDISAALIGRKYGKHKLFNKSLEGTAAFIVTALIVVGIIGFMFKGDYWFFSAGILGSVIGGLVELYSTQLKLDDNLSIPISVGLTMLAVNILAIKFNASFLGLIH